MYSTLKAVGDMFVIYGIVIIVSMLVATVIRGIVIVLSRHQGSDKQQSNIAISKDKKISSAISEEHVAAITAVINCMVGHRIVHIENINRGFGWLAEARTTHHTSHVPRVPH